MRAETCFREPQPGGPQPPSSTGNGRRRALALATGLLLLLPVLGPRVGTVAPAFAAGLSLDKVVVRHQASAATSITSPTFSTAQPGELLVAFIASDGPPSGGSTSFRSVSTPGLTWALEQRANDRWGDAEIWTAWAASALSGATVSAALDSGSWQSSLVVAAFAGASPVQDGAVAATSAASGAPSVTLTTRSGGSWVWAVGNDWDTATQRSVGADQVLVDQMLTSVGDTYWVQRRSATTALAGTSVTIDDIAPTADQWNLAAIEIVAAPGDTEPPSSPSNVQASAPAPNRVSLSWTASTDNLGVAGYDIVRDGTTVGTSTTTSYADATVVPATTYSYAVFAFDAAGNRSAPSGSATVTTPADTTPPTVAITAPAAGASVSGTVLVQADATDDVGVAAVQFLLDGSPLGAPVGSAPYQLSWDTTAAPPGPHTLAAQATDSAGNQAVSAGVAVTVSGPVPDTIPPSVSITAPPDGTAVSGTISVTVAATDNVGVTSVRLTLDGSDLGSADSSAPYSFSWDTTTATAGAHTLVAVAQDASGNTGMSASVGVIVNNSSQANVNVDGSRQFQAIDGFGVNALAKTWQGGALKPGIDLLVGMGASLWRVDVNNGHSDWETSNDNSDPFTYNWAYYGSVYEQPSFQDLWSELSYLNSKGVTGIELSMSGLVPTWMGGNSIPGAEEDEFVEEATSIVYYARHDKGIQFRYFSPFNETNFGPPEGPSVGPDQFARIMDKIASRLDSLGMSDVQLVGPHTTSFEQPYTQAMLGYPNLMKHIQAFSYHSYGTELDAPSFAEWASQVWAGTPYADRHVWVGEWNQCATDGCLDGGQQPADEWVFAKELTTELLNHLEAGVSAAEVWDAWDNWHEHNPCCAIDHWGEIYQDAGGAWVTKKRYYTNEQVFRFVAPGMTRIGASTTLGGLKVLAFSNSATGELTIVGQNQGNSAANLSVSLTSVPSPASLNLYQSSATKNLEAEGAVAAGGGHLSVTVDADSFFTLSNVKSPLPPPDTTPPSAPSNLTATATSPTSVSLAWAAATDDHGVSGYDVSRNGTVIGDSATLSYTDAAAASSTTYEYSVTAHDAAGNVGPPSNVATVTTPAETAPPVISQVAVSALNTTLAGISWLTDRPATSQVLYGLTAAYGLVSALDANLVTAHSQTLTGLVPGTAYHFAVRSADGSGNVATSADHTFTTHSPQLLAVDVSVFTHQRSGSSKITSPRFSTSAPQELLVAFLASDGPAAGAQAFSTVTGGGLTWSLRSRANLRPGTAEIWTAAANTKLTGVAVTAKRSSGSYAGSLGVVSLTGADTALVGATAAGSGTGLPGVSLTTTRNGSWVWAVGNDWAAAAPRTVGAGQTMVDQYLAPVGDTFWIQRRTEPVAVAGTTVRLDDTSPTGDPWNLAAIEILQS